MIKIIGIFAIAYAVQNIIVATSIKSYPKK